MKIPKKIYFKLRPYILPINEILKWVPSQASIVDLGCGKGILTQYLNNYTKYNGVDLVVPSNNFEKNIEYTKQDCLDFIKKDLKAYNTFLVIDLLHHIPKERQNAFLNSILFKMKIGDRIIIKDILPKNPLTKFWNSFHDFLISKQIINYFDFINFEKKLSFDIKIISNFHKRIFLYDHYFLILEKN